MLAESELLLVVVGFMIAFVLAFGIGANDVANSFGTSVGSKVLSLKAACILATIFEISGSVLLGGQVSATIRNGIVEPEKFNNTTNGAMKLMYGQVASLSSSCLWMLVATFFKLPVSGSHSIVGATAGFALVLFGVNGVQWMGILKIVISWFVSPLLSGIVSTFVFFILKKTVLTKAEPIEPALYTLPFIYGVTVLINVFSVLYGGLSIFGVREIKLWIVLVASFASGILTSLIVFFFVRPYLRKKVLKKLAILEQQRIDGLKIEEETHIVRFKRCVRGFFTHSKRTDPLPLPPSVDLELSDATNSTQKHTENLEVITDDAPEDTSDSLSNGNRPAGPVDGDVESVGNVEPADDDFDDTVVEFDPVIVDRPEEAAVFSFAQILSAIFGSFVHGGNDVSNAIGPVVGLWLVAISGDPLNSAPSPIWILFYGGIGISVGLWIWGRKVMETVGTDLTTITPSSGMCIELGSAVTVLIASKLGIPISTTHCKVGSVVCVGRFRAKSNVNWKLFLNIVAAWFITLPVSAGLSALIMYAFMATVPM